ncbi:hypothetical protein ASF43_17030 [Pseudorhodoferax sp. Leaf267]|nr:hypothetical protein ASF43_17030 [Pseudorhodoferax sp. Leaf267]
MCCGLLLGAPWPQAQAAPVVLQQATHNGTGDAPGRFSALLQGGADDQATLQLFTAPGAGGRISGLYVQDATGAIARDTLSGDPLVRLSQTQVHEVLLNDAGANKLAVIKALSSALGIGLTQAKRLADAAPVVIRSAGTPDGNAQLQRQLQDVGARVTLSSRQDPSAPAGANVGVTTPGGTPTGYDVVLARAGTNKVALIKLVRDATGLSLAEAKKLVDEVPSVVQANASRAEALALRQALQDSGATVELKPVGTGAVGQGPIVLPPGSAGIAPDLQVRFAYADPLAIPALQLTFELGVDLADLLGAWQSGQFRFGVEVTDAAGVSDLYLAPRAAAPTEVPEPPTGALILGALLCLWWGTAARRNR